MLIQITPYSSSYLLYDSSGTLYNTFLRLKLVAEKHKHTMTEMSITIARDALVVSNNDMSAILT